MSKKLRDVFGSIEYSTTSPDLYLTSFRPSKSYLVTYPTDKYYVASSWIDQSILDMEINTVLAYYNLGLITSDPYDEDELISYLTSLK